MSSIYVTEPPTHGKVLLTTNKGEIEIELWSREAPKASRNFIQLCLEGYYIDTIFHRIVPNFIIQGGDPSGTGTGGQSIYDDPFVDEFHSRLKYTRRGLVGMANNGTKNDNGSQFFITLDTTAELQGRNTLFGRIAGDTIYNVTKIGASECQDDGSDRPLYPPRIIKTEVIVNPFNDIVPRTTREETEARRKAQVKANTVPTKKPKKNIKLLSFNNADEQDDNDDAVVVEFKSRGKSVHDLVSDDRLAPAPLKTKRRRVSIKQPDTTILPVTQQASTPIAPVPRSPSPSPPPLPTKEDSVAAQIAQLTSSLKRKHAPSATTTQPKLGVVDSKLSYLEQQKAEYAKKAVLGGRKKGRLGHSEDDTLSRLSLFQSKLASSSKTPVQQQKETTTMLCALHAVPNCASCSVAHPTGADDDDDDDDEGWYQHTLIFEQDKLGKDGSLKKAAEMELEVIDPRQKAGQLALQRRQERREKEERTGRNQFGGKR